MRFTSLILGIVLMSTLDPTALAEPPPSFQKFGLYVAVTDLQRSRAFYEQLFGKAPYVANEKFIGFDVAGGLFAAFVSVAPTTRGNATVPYIRVADARAEYERVRKFASGMLDDAVVRDGPLDLFRFTDPDGNVIEFFAVATH